MSKFELYASEQLPAGFVYPSEIQDFATTGEYPDLGPWWFIDANSKAGKLAYSVRQCDGRNLIPFAKVDDGRGDVACFDGDDTSGNPKVCMLVLDDSGRSYSFASFSEWKVSALRDAAG
ncbi:SMI1/KNR4 family protein [Burkholderia sp. PU8-34]